VLSEIRTLVSSILDVDEIRLNQETDLFLLDNWDSLRHIELITAIEQKFGVRLEGSHIVRIRYLGDIEVILTEVHTVSNE